MKVAVATATTPPRQATPTPRGRRPCPAIPSGHAPPPIIGTRQPASRAPAASLRKLRERFRAPGPGPAGRTDQAPIRAWAHPRLPTTAPANQPQTRPDHRNSGAPPAKAWRAASY